MQDAPTYIPVFVSRPSRLTPDQQTTFVHIRKLMDCHSPTGHDRRLQFTSIGLAEYTTKSPLESVLEVIQKCYGGLILGFDRSQTDLAYGSHATATPWSQIETALLLARNVPVLILREAGVRGGVFDQGASGHIIVEMPKAEPFPEDDWFKPAFTDWARQVVKHYEEVQSIFDVFLSFSSEDESFARDVFEFLTSQGLRVFFSRESIAQADYMKPIHAALGTSRHMIVISSSAEGFSKRWVEQEWTIFLNEKLSGRKSGNLVVVPARPVPVSQLPIALRAQQVVYLDRNCRSELLKFVS